MHAPVQRQHMFACANWIIKHTSASAVICVVHTDAFLGGEMEAPAMQVCGASFMTVFGDVLLLSAICSPHGSRTL